MDVPDDQDTGDTGYLAVGTSTSQLLLFSVSAVIGADSLGKVKLCSSNYCFSSCSRR